MDMDIDMNAEATTAQSGTSTLSPPTTPLQPSSTSPLTTTTTLMSLPTELILQILYFLPLPLLLAFRLVSKWTNTLVLEPVFWHRLEFSKQLLFKVGGTGSVQQRHRRISFGLGSGAALPGGVGVGGGTGGGGKSVSQHNSDANLLVHRQSLAGTLLSPTTTWVEDTFAVANVQDAGGGIGAGPSMNRSANIPHLHPSHQQHQRDTLSTSPTSPTCLTAVQQLPKTSPWTKIETSFLHFLTCLALNPRTAHGVQSVMIENWEGADSVQVLWTTLKAFRKLRTLVVRKSVLRHLHFHQTNDHSNDKNDETWSELEELDFQDCVQLKDLERIQNWLPHLQDLSLAGCTALEDFSPLSRSSSSGGESPSPALVLKRASFIHTRIQDEELIALLRRSPDLEELRLDQCYGLTVRALEAIAFGDQTPILSGGLVQVGGELGPAPVPTMGPISHEAAQLAPPHHFTTTTSNTGSSHTTVGSSQPLHSLLTSISSPPILSSSSPPTSTPTTLPLLSSQHSSKSSGSYVPYLRKLSLKNCYDFTDEGIRSLVGCRHLEWLVIRGIRQVNEDTAEWLHSQGVPLRKLLSPLGRWRHWHV
ncbi:hypothetical protein BG015_004566 [Linnemannia schmuckeri]|uniref:F-box domain-containing protein n=1 Tax=Linnemannia schmuckeri TaxID=64567 RepID=A0A9P5S1G5_9FUNG|nr:hypothetical protein BG015_004566 [Linnemannia schmuckeri]